MRTEEQMIRLLLSVAKEEERIRAVILNGSRTNAKVAKDDFQDFDIIYLVKDLVSFKADFSWIDVFGERIILQMPNAMKIEEYDLSSEKKEIVYLMLLKDFNRIDLTLMSLEDWVACTDSLNKVLLDKDNLLEPLPAPSDKDYWIKMPSQKEFSDCCNEFWWVSTYVVKGLARKEPLYAKEMLEIPVRSMFMKMLAWYVGAKKGFSLNLGMSNRFLKRYISSEMWESVLATYPDANLNNIWRSLRVMTKIFHETGTVVAQHLGLDYNLQEAMNVQEYLQFRAQHIFK